MIDESEMKNPTTFSVTLRVQNVSAWEGLLDALQDALDDVPEVGGPMVSADIPERTLVISFEFEGVRDQEKDTTTAFELFRRALALASERQGAMLPEPAALEAAGLGHELAFA